VTKFKHYVQMTPHEMQMQSARVIFTCIQRYPRFLDVS